MASKKEVVRDAPWIELTYKIIGLAMEVHNELGPGHREIAYHNAMIVKLTQAGLAFESEPYVPITLEDGTVVSGASPDLVVKETVIVELKAHFFTITRDEQAQMIEYFATFEHCPVALYFNFGRPRLEWHRLFPPTTVHTYQRRKWGKS